MPLTFTYVPDRGFSKESTSKVTGAQFGSGYSQRITVGINTRDESWELSFRNRSIADINAIVSFLETNNGVDYFYWTPPGESTAVKVICSKWNVDYNSEFSKSLSCSFKRVYDLT